MKAKLRDMPPGRGCLPPLDRWRGERASQGKFTLPYETLRLAQLGQSFVYHRSLSRAAEEARRTQPVPVVLAEK
jgi:hypothetical protein